MTITFLTLFFGLITGPFPVQMAVSGPVAAVELTVDDGAPVRLAGPPWKTTLDFGSALVPHRVVARALDREGHELVRAEEWANLPHPHAKAEIVLEAEKDGVPRAARVVWTNVLGEKPQSTSLTFDGQALRLDRSGRAELPAHDLKTIHVLTAEVRFRSDPAVRKDVAYGGEYGSEISTELTGVPVRVLSGTLPPLKDLRGWFTAGGRELAVTAMEDGPAELLVVRVPSAYKDTRKLGSKGLLPSDIRFDMRLDKEALIRFIKPYAEQVQSSDQEASLFNFGIKADYKTGGLSWLIRGWQDDSPRGVLKRSKEKPPADRELWIADAVAVAGLEAIKDNRRRAVLLVLKGDESEDYSHFDPEAVRCYLAAIHVPLFVWTLGKTVPGSFAAAWSPSEQVDEVPGLYRAVDRVDRELRSQRVVLVEGRYLPQSLALGPAAKGVELAGGAGARTAD